MVRTVRLWAVTLALAGALANGAPVAAEHEEYPNLNACHGATAGAQAQSDPTLIAAAVGGAGTYNRLVRDGCWEEFGLGPNPNGP